MALEGGPGKYKGIRQAQGVSGGEKGRRTHRESQWPSAGITQLLKEERVARQRWVGAGWGVCIVLCWGEIHVREELG